MSVSVLMTEPGTWGTDIPGEPAPVVELHPGDREAPRRRLAYVPASTVRTEKIEWLMQAWIPRRSLTLLAGREGLGKSTLACAICAKATRGQLDNGAPLKALYLATEDSRSMTVKPRLQAAGADLEMVGFLDVSFGELGGSLTLPGDYPLLEELIREEGIGFVVLDAAKSAMSSTLNDYRDDDVRRFLEPMAKIADDHDVAFLALVHFGKRASTDSGNLILGSIAWSQVARSVVSVAKDDETGTLVVSNTKGNLADRELSREVAIVSTDVPLADGGTTTTGRIEWLGESKRSARDLLGAREDEDGADERGEVEAVVIDYLESQGGSAPAGDVLKAARAAGLSESTVKKSRRKIGVKTGRRGFGKGAQWVWTIDSAIDAHTQNRESMDSMEPMGDIDSIDGIDSSLKAQAPIQESLPGQRARNAVLDMLKSGHHLAERTIAGGVAKDHRDDVPAVLAALVSDGLATLDANDRYTLAEVAA